MAFGISGNKSSSRSNMNQDVFGGGNFENMYGQFGDQYGAQQQNANLGFGMMPGMQDQMGNVFDSGYGGMQEQLGGGSYGDTSRYNDMLFSSMNDGGPSATGRMYEDIVGGPGNTYIDPMVDAMKTGMMENRDMMNSQAGLDATAMGQGGGSRHAMQNSFNDRSTAQDMNMAEMGMRGGAYDTDMGWKMDIARQADSNTQLDRDRMMSMIGGGNQSKQAGMNFGGQAQNLSMGQMAPWMQAMQGPWQNMQNYSSAMGDPTVLTDASSKSSSAGGGFGF